MIESAHTTGRALLVVVLLTFLVCVCDDAVARDYPPSREKNPMRSAQPARLNAGEAANIAQSATGARVLAVSLRGNSYRVKLLRDNGVVFSVRVNAYSGKVSR